MAACKCGIRCRINIALSVLCIYCSMAMQLQLNIGGIPVTNNEVHNEINSRNACFYSVLTLFPSIHSPKQQKTRQWLLHVFVPGRCPFRMIPVRLWYMICLNFLEFHLLNTSVIPKNVPKPPFLPPLYIHVFIGQSGERMGH